MHSSGLYRIEIGDRFYFGQSIHLRKRNAEHQLLLRTGKHNNPYMQRAYNLCRSYKFVVLSEISVDMLDKYEQRLLDAWVGQPKCMNVAKCAEAPARGRRASYETRAKLSAAHKGKTHTPEARAKISRAKLGEKKNPESVEKTRQANLGRKRSASAVDRAAAAIIKPVAMPQVGAVFPSVKSCAEFLGVHGSAVSHAIANQAKVCGLFAFFVDGLT